jgi:hypothetical protein
MKRCWWSQIWLWELLRSVAEILGVVS